MTDERYKQIMADLGMPNSRSLLEALRQVANEAAQAARQDSNVMPLLTGDVSRRTDVALRTMDATIVGAINSAREAGVPHGLIVGLLHGLAHDQTAAMMNGT